MTILTIERAAYAAAMHNAAQAEYIRLAASV
jgi:hypothetical protein